CTQTVLVEPGDSCVIIVARFNIPSDAVPLLNPTISCSGLFAGESICVASPAVNCSKVDVIQSGDSCFSIATAFKITLTELFSLNPNVDSVSCANIFPGEVLCVAPRH
ncbi:carbohydrate-binding module family 50 protein, partial [Sphaerobolus stellatus SS14]